MRTNTDHGVRRDASRRVARRMAASAIRIERSPTGTQGSVRLPRCASEGVDEVL